MKHTMKKLLCMALAIMLLVSAVPVFAAAEDIHVDVVYEVDASGNPVQWVTCYPVNGVITDADRDKIASKISGLGVVGWTFNGLTKSRIQEFNFESLQQSVNVFAVFPEKQYVKVTVDYGDNRTYTYDVEVGAPLGASVLPANPTRTGRRFLYWYYGSNTYNAQSVADASYNGLTFTAAWETVGCTECGEEVGHKTTCSQYEDNGATKPSQPSQPSGSTTAAYVSVILSTKTSNFAAGDYINCNLVNGKITPADRNKVADAISSKGLNIIRWKRADNGTQASSLVDFDFAGLAEPINILPIFGANTPTTPTTPSTTGKLSLTIRVNGTKKYDNDVKNFTTATVGDVIKNIYDSDWTSKYAFDKVVVNGVTYGRSDLEVMAGDEVDVYLTRKYSKDNSNKVYLHVYLNGDASTIAMTKDITGTYLMDDWKTDTTEILNYLKNNYYTAKNTSNAITIDGLYVSTDTKGAFPSNYYADNKTASKDDINDLLEDGYVHISVMLKNAKAKTSATADSSNPKTGDTIFVPVMVMGLTATALAVAYVFGKKRIAR